MITNLRPTMAEALRLTRSGNLREAAALIQTTLAGVDARRTSTNAAGGPVIDLVPTARTIRTSAPNTDRPAQSPTHAGAPGSFEERSYRGPAGKLAYWLYRPQGLIAGMPVVVMLHGCTQTAEDFARGTAMNKLADELGFIVVYPVQSRTANAQRCWNWFKPGDQQRDRGEPALIAAIAHEVVAEHRADSSRVYVAGLSAGGAAAAIMAAAYPDVFAAVGIHSGLACGAARDLPSALAAMKNAGGSATAPSGNGFVPVITFHGDRDGTVHEGNSRQIIAAASASVDGAVRIQTETRQADGGRRFTRTATLSEQGQPIIEQWTIHGGGHAWSGGDPSGSYTDRTGPDASREMLRFFLSHRLADTKGERS